MRQQWKSQNGMSLLSVIMAVGMGGVIAAGMAGMMSSGFLGQKSVKLRSEIHDAKGSISRRLSCDQTLGGLAQPVTSCGDTNGRLDLLDASGNIFVAADGSTRLAGWNIQAICRDEVVNGVKAYGITILATKPIAGSPGQFQVDPLSHIAFDENNPVGKLYRDDGRPCEEYFGNKVGSKRKCPDGKVVTEIKSDGTVVCDELTLKDLSYEKVVGVGNNHTNPNPAFKDTPGGGLMCGWTPNMEHVWGEVCCPAGKVPLSGGGDCNSGAGGGYTESSMPSGTNCWFVDCCKNTPHGAFNLHALCFRAK